MENLGRKMEEQIPRLRRYALALVGDPNRADDLVQDCLERAWQRLHLWKRGGNMRAWLFTILHNVHANSARKFFNSPTLVTLNNDWGGPAVRASQSDGLELEDIMAALRRLPEEQRQVMLLVGMEQMRYQEVAAVLGIPLGTVMSRLFRGRERLRAMLSGKPSSALRKAP